MAVHSVIHRMGSLHVSVCVRGNMSFTLHYKLHTIRVQSIYIYIQNSETQRLAGDKIALRETDSQRAGERVWLT